ncbi:MAG: UPF0158 family protein, partial [Chloroflexota bacterium]
MPKIDMDFLIMALEDHSEMVTYYLDRQTGEVAMSSDYSEDESLSEQLEDDPDRFVWIEPQPSHEAFEIMADFVEDLPDGEERRLLERALAWRSPFSNFRSALREMPA